MKKSLISLVVVFVFFFLSFPEGDFLVSAAAKLTNPTAINIPSIKLNSKIEKVGKDDKGRMAVPSGKTDNIGWYERGTIPGETGSAVLAAHVYAAFKNLKKVRTGDEIIV